MAGNTEFAVQTISLGGPSGQASSDAAPIDDRQPLDAAAPESTATAVPEAVDAPSAAVEPRAPVVVSPPAPADWVDVLTEADGPRMWDRFLRAEQSRNSRHGRTSTIVLVEVDGYATTAQRWGDDLALQLFVRLAQVLASGVRSSDYIARLGPTRFGILLTETDEISAINFVDRVRVKCDTTVDPVTNGLRVVFGWASPEVGGRLTEARPVAEARLSQALGRDA